MPDLRCPHPPEATLTLWFCGECGEPRHGCAHRCLPVDQREWPAPAIPVPAATTIEPRP